MNAVAAGQLYRKVRATLNPGAVHAGARRPFVFFLGGAPALVNEMRIALLSGHEDGTISSEAAAALVTLDPERTAVDTTDARAVIWCVPSGGAAAAPLTRLVPLGLPVLVLTVDPQTTAPAGPPSAPKAGEAGDYAVDRIAIETLAGRFLPHLIDCCRGIEIAVGRQLPALRETVCAKLTRDAALAALKIAGASAVIDHVPVLGIVLGAFASAGDTVAITGIQMQLLLNIGATYGRDPDLSAMWELLPIVGGGFGWRALARELSGFIPVGGMFIKAAIAYAGTVVVGEGGAYFYRHGTQMNAVDAARIYADAKTSAAQFARDVLAHFRSGSS